MGKRRPGFGRRALALALGTAAMGVVQACEPLLGPSAPPLLQTNSQTYGLRSDGIGFAVDIEYVFTNRTGGPVYLPNCRGAVAMHLERNVNRAWRFAWNPVYALCLSPPIVIPEGSMFVDTLHVWGASPGQNWRPQFDVGDPSGTYRIVWDGAHSSYDAEQPGAGQQISLDSRISNSFKLEVTQPVPE